MSSPVFGSFETTQTSSANILSGLIFFPKNTFCFLIFFYALQYLPLFFLEFFTFLLISNDSELEKLLLSYSDSSTFCSSIWLIASSKFSLLESLSLESNSIGFFSVPIYFLSNEFSRISQLITGYSTLKLGDLKVGVQEPSFASLTILF